MVQLQPRFLLPPHYIVGVVFIYCSLRIHMLNS
jgi:hypothetical protein